MAKHKKKKGRGKAPKGANVRLAPRVNDPVGAFTSYLNQLPAVDDVLRKLGVSHEVYRRLYGDPHVMGELRSVRSGLLRYEYRVEPGGPSRAAKNAAELCEKILSRRPYQLGRWPDTIWTMAGSVWEGLAAHEVTWKREGMQLVPDEIIDRPARRFVFNAADNELRLLTRRAPYNGEEIPDMRVLLTRHMPSYENPYGEAVFSTCVWPFFFKRAGFEHFVRFIEKFGLPWAVGKQPPDVNQEEQDRLLEGLLNMVEGNAGAIPNDSSVEVFNFNSGSTSLPQERLIAVCNKEMSKALTSQTLSTEIQGSGSRAAAETHHEREAEVHESDREMIAATFNELFSWITLVNFGPDVPSPIFLFFEEMKPKIAEAEFLEKARKIVPVSKDEAYERMGLRMPRDGEETVSMTGQMMPENSPETPPNGGQNAMNFAAAQDVETVLDALSADTMDELSQDLVMRVLTRADNDPEGLAADAANASGLVSDELTETLARAMFALRLIGRDSVDAAEEEDA